MMTCVYLLLFLIDVKGIVEGCKSSPRKTAVQPEANKDVGNVRNVIELMLKEDLAFNPEEKETLHPIKSTTPKIEELVTTTTHDNLLRDAKEIVDESSLMKIIDSIDENGGDTPYNLQEIGKPHDQDLSSDIAEINTNDNKHYKLVKEPDRVNKICELKYYKTCFIEMTPKYMQVEVEVCRKKPVKGCDREKQCRTEYFTRCWSEMEFTRQVEDKPSCEEVEEDNVLVTRCNIVKKTVRKARPVSKCKRTPRQLCSSNICQSDTSDPVESCHMETKLIKEVNPKETCEMKPKTVCQITDEHGKPIFSEVE